MLPPIYTVCNVASVQAELGTPVRVYPFGDAPQDVAKPYAVWQVIEGEPENFLGDTPDLDRYGIQVDVYGLNTSTVMEAARSLRNVLEPICHITRWDGTTRDPETRNYRYSFDLDFKVSR